MIKFSYNIKKDAENWVDTVKDINPSWRIDYDAETIMVSRGLKNKILKTDKEKSVKLVIDYFKDQTRFKYKREIINSEMKAIKILWGNREKDFFDMLERITKQPMFSSDFRAYFTTMFICPYDKEKYKWFMLNMWHSLPFQITIMCHEIFHFQFLHYYVNFCKEYGLNEDQIEDLKESLTVLLNAKEFDDIILCQDGGYPKHQIIREKIINDWERNKNDYLKKKDGFKLFLKKTIKYIK